MDPHPRVLDLLISEYERLKAEQTQRIGFRDNLVYANFAAAAGAITFSVGDAKKAAPLLVIPLVSAVLGWMSIDNDQKISAIGRYISGPLRTDVERHTRSHAGEQGIVAFAWEDYVRAYPFRKWRKGAQLAANLLTFCGSGILAIAAYHFVRPDAPPVAVIAMWGDAVLIAVIAMALVVHADIWAFSDMRGGRHRRPSSRHGR